MTTFLSKSRRSNIADPESKTKLSPALQTRTRTISENTMPKLGLFFVFLFSILFCAVLFLYLQSQQTTAISHNSELLPADIKWEV